ncbi:guanylate kinase [Portibacter marinus]|uniref:guanylate kinase n=1 Tax=Portibacter marinus TaxID=2898660 RepID=UPI001F1FE122|nr:guanylate kinase [Portibacter marinus]
MSFKGKMLVFTAPSGAGKTTIVRHLLSEYEALDFSISATTRARRDYERHGRDYYFMSPEEFRYRAENDEFLEWEEVYEDQFYGTLKSEVDRLWSMGKHIVFDIDVRGATNIKRLYGDDCLAVFVKPPSVEVLIKRLRDRKTESDASFAKRVKRVKREMQYEHDFDKILVNDLLEVTLKEAEYLVEGFLNIKNE